MFAIVYEFVVEEGKEQVFRDSWERLTRLIRELEGSQGSRLHQDSQGSYIAYALWKDEETWLTSGEKLSGSAGLIRERMSSVCSDIRVVYQMECLTDFLGSLSSEE